MKFRRKRRLLEGMDVSFVKLGSRSRKERDMQVGETTTDNKILIIQVMVREAKEIIKMHSRSRKKSRGRGPGKSDITNTQRSLANSSIFNL